MEGMQQATVAVKCHCENCDGVFSMKEDFRVGTMLAECPQCGPVEQDKFQKATPRRLYVVVKERFVQ